MDNKQTLLKNCFNVIKERGFYYQSTGQEELEKLLTSKPTSIYIGIDPTADSLHIGHCFPLFMLNHLQKAGHKIYIVIGGATAMIGDPTGKTDMRKMVEESFINSNLDKIKNIIGRFLDINGENPVTFVNNYDWMKDYNYISFMREIGTHFNVNKMLATDAYSKRLEQGGLTFFEMGYMLMQAYDFVYLNRKYGVAIQVGGQDQWANMLAGAELGRKLNNMEGKPQDDFQAFTVPLLTTSEGKKMGKTEKGALWVDENKTSPYEFYQYFYNVDDKDVEKLLKTMTTLPLEEIKKLLSGDIRNAKKVMAYEITKAVHGVVKANEALNASQELFSSGNAQNAPTCEFTKEILPTDIASLCVQCELTISKGEARKLIEQGGIYLNGEKVNSYSQIISKQDFVDGYLILKKGKKTFIKVVLK